MVPSVSAGGTGCATYLKKTPTKPGRVSLSAVRDYRDESGRTRQRTVRTFGFVDALEAEFEDPVAHFRAVVAEMDDERLREEAGATIEIHPGQRVDKRESGRLRRRAGDALACWRLDALGVEAAVRNGMRGRGVGYDLNAALRLLVCERLLDPGSKRAAWEARDSHFFRAELSDDDVHRALDELDGLSERIADACNRSIAANSGRDESLVYHDVTNYFFECDPDADGTPQEGRQQGAQAQPHRADGAPAGLGGHTDRLRPVQGQHERLRDAAAGPQGAPGAWEGPRRRGRRQGHEPLGQHSGRGRRRRALRRRAVRQGRHVRREDRRGARGSGGQAAIDEAAIDEAARLDGYHLIVTSETDWEDFRILDAFREPWRIEESFKVTKTGGLESRPVWAWTEPHIRAHFLTCYLALLIVRLSQRAPPSHPSARALLEDMRDLGCSYADDGWWLFDHRTDLTDEIFALADEEAPRKWMRTADVRALFKKGKKIHWR